MSVVHYKFRSSLEYDSVTFDGLSISLGDLKEAISSQKKLGKNSTDLVNLQVTNAQTKEEYVDESAQIPKNSSVIVKRIPNANAQPKNKTQLGAERADMYTSGLPKPVEGKDRSVSGTLTSSSFGRGPSISTSASSEEDKIKALISEAGADWDPSKYTVGRGRGYVPAGPLPPSYVCYRCGQPGHYIRNCPTNTGSDMKFEPRIKRNTGIPRQWIGDETIDESKMPSSEGMPVIKVKKIIPAELQCAMCKNLLTDAVVIPCCGESCCDDCIRNHLLENEQVCPLCHSEDISPDSVVINKHLRQAVKNFNTSSQSVVSQPASSSSAVSTTTKTLPHVEQPKQQVIKSEADSTKNNETAVSKDQPDSGVKHSSAGISSSVSTPSSVSSQFVDVGNGVKSSFNVPPQGHPQAPPFYKGDKPPHPMDNQPMDAHMQYPGRPRMSVVANVGVRPHPVMGHRPPYPLQKSASVPMSLHDVPRPIPTSVHMDFVPRFPSHLQPMQPLGPAPGFPSARMHNRMHGFNNPVNEMMPGVPGLTSKPMSKEEFYRAQRRLKDRPVEKRKKPPRRRHERDPIPPLRHGNFDDELLQYEQLQKKMRKRSPSVSSTSSRSSSPDRRSGSFSSFGPSRSVTPEGWDRSRSPTPSPELKKQKQTLRDSGRSRESTPASPKRKRTAKTTSDVPAKKKRTDNREKTSRKDDETRSSKKESSDESKKTAKKTDSSSSKRPRKEVGKDDSKPKKETKEDSKKPKTSSDTSTVKNTEPSETSEKQTESSSKKKKESSKSKTKKKHKRKEKKDEKSSKRDSKTKASQGEVTTKGDEDEFDIVQEKDVLLKNTDKTKTKDSAKTSSKEKSKKKETVAPETSVKTKKLESEKDQLTEEDFDAVQEEKTTSDTKPPVNETESIAEKDEANKASSNGDIVDSSQQERQTNNTDNKTDEDTNQVSENTEKHDETEVEMAEIGEEEVKNDNENESGQCTKESKTVQSTSEEQITEEAVKEVEEEVFASTASASAESDVDELDLSVLVGKEDRRDSFLNELLSDEESQELENKQEPEKPGSADTKHKKHKKRDKKHKHKKHKKKHKHKKNKKHKKEKGEEAVSTAESQATQSESQDGEESDDSEMEEVFRGPRSVVVPAAASQSQSD